MSELALSSDLGQITTEIKTYQAVSGQAIFEIARRLKWVKQHDLVHGEWLAWLQSIKMNDRVARKFMTVADVPELETSTSSELGLEALYNIAMLPESQRNIEHETASGEMKKPEDMTIREQRDLRKELDKEKARSENLLVLLDEANNQEPVKVEVPVPTVPDDYAAVKAADQKQREQIEYLKRRNSNLAETIESMAKEREQQSKDSEKYQELTKRMQELSGEVGRLELKKTAAVDMIDLKGQMSDLLNQMAPELYAIDFMQFKRDDPAMQTLRSTLDKVDKWVADMRAAMPGNIQEGVIING